MNIVLSIGMSFRSSITRYISISLQDSEAELHKVARIGPDECRRQTFSQCLYGSDEVYDFLINGVLRGLQVALNTQAGKKDTIKSAIEAGSILGVSAATFFGEKFFEFNPVRHHDVMSLRGEYGRLSHRIRSVQLSELTEKDWRTQGQLRIGGNVALDWRIGEILWLFHFYLIHHRGQLSAYLRPMGSTVPSIYGRSGDFVSHST